VVYAGSGDDQVYAIGGDNRVYGEDGRDTLITADGNDFIDAGPGDDPDVQAGRGNDRVYGRGGNDTLRGSEGDDLVDGGDGHDRVIGGSGTDTRLGGAGADTLEGRTGKDYLTGGGDADRFKVDGAGESVAGGGRDVVLDMTGIDRIDLSAIDPGAAGGDQAFAWLGQSANAGPLASGSLRALDLGSTVIVQANSDADAAIDLEVELRNFTATLVRDDFLL
jgi:Ca2+-binding RTX toxin-like protein